MFEDDNSRTSVTLAASIAVAVALVVGTLFAMTRQRQAAAIQAETASRQIQVQAMQPKQAELAPGVPVPFSQSPQLIEDNVNFRPRFTSPWMDLKGYKCDEGQRVNWNFQGTVADVEIEFVINLRSTADSQTYWESEAKQPLILIGDDRRADLPCKRSEQRAIGEAATLIECRGGMETALVIARAKNPKFVFGHSVCDLGPQGAATAREFVKRAGMIQQKRSGRTEAEATADVRTWLGEK